MQYRTIVGTDLTVSAIGLGCNAFGSRADRETSLAIIDRAIESGITLLDTADVYCDGRSEDIVGEALQGRRSSVVLSTKGGGASGPSPAPKGSSRAHLTAALEGSLRRLRTDHVDIYYVHYFDPQTPDEETFGALDELVRAGKVRYVAVSNYAAWQVCRALWSSDRHGYVRCAAVQASYSLVDRTCELEMLPLCLDQGMGLFAFWPLGGGLLSGKYRHDAPPPAGSRVLTQPKFARSFSQPRLLLAERAAELALAHGCSPAQLALAWVLGRTGVTSVLNGATKMHQLEENLGSAELRLDEEAVKSLDELSESSIRTPFR